MPVVATIEVDKKDLARIKKFPSNITSEIKKGMVTVSKMLQKETRVNVAKDTGHLAFGGRKDSKYGPGGIFGIASFKDMSIYLIGKTVYATILELGGETRNYTAQPYLRPTVYENWEKIVDTLANSMSEAWGK